MPCDFRTGKHGEAAVLYSYQVDCAGCYAPQGDVIPKSEVCTDGVYICFSTTWRAVKYAIFATFYRLLFTKT